MNVSFDGKKVALCGEFPYDISHILISNGARIVIWSNTLDILLCGENITEKAKYKKAQTLSNIHIVYWREIESTIRTQLWTDLYAPQSIHHIIGHADVIQTLYQWLNKWKRGTQGVFISGPPGIGKTTLAHIVSRSAKYEIIEFNASDCRSASQIKTLFENATSSGVVGPRRVIIMDEVDGMSSGDRGGVGELAQIIKSAGFPIICIANDRSNPKMKPLMNACIELKCSRPTKTTIAKAIYERIVKSEHLTIGIDAIETLVEKSGNDIRQIINTLQFELGTGSGSKKDAILRMDPFYATGLLFKTPPDADLETRMNYVYLDHGLVPLMVAEGYLGAAGRTGAGGLDGAVQSAHALEMYDVLDTRIHRSQAWSLLPAAVTSIVEAAAAARGPAPFQIFPQWLGKSSKSRKHRRWMSELARRLGVSAANVMDMRETLRTQLFGLKDASVIVDKLIELGITRDDMFEVLSETVFTGDEKTVSMETKLKSAVTREWKKRGLNDACVIADGTVSEDTSDDIDDDDDFES